MVNRNKTLITKRQSGQGFVFFELKPTLTLAETLIEWTKEGKKEWGS